MSHTFISTLALAGVSCFPLVSARPSPQTGKRSTPAKRGLAFNSGNLTDLFVDYDAVTWGYNWSPTPAGINSKFEFVPLLYSDPTGNQEYISNWQNGAQAAIDSGTTHLLAFNEPEINNLPPAQAATAYMNYMQPFASDTVQLGGPAVTNGGAPDGLTWLGEFLGNCTDCTIDFIPFHWYCGYEQISYFSQYVQECQQAAGGRPIWFTEFQGDNVYCNAPATDAQQTQFMQTVLPWLDSLDYVERYAYFYDAESTSSDVYLVNTEGNGLTESGMTYATSSAVNSTTPTSLVNS